MKSNNQAFTCTNEGERCPVVGDVPVMAEGAAGAEPAGERATVAKPKAFAPWMQGQARREVEMPPRKARMNALKRCHRASAMRYCERARQKTNTYHRRCCESRDPKGRAGCVHEMPQGSPNEGKSERDTSPRRDPKEGALASWDPGGKSTRKQILKSKRPVEAKDIAPVIDARNKARNTWPHQNQ